MAYEGSALKRVGTAQLTFETYELHLTDEDKQRFSDDSEGFLTEFLAKENAPEPNELVVHDAAEDTSDALIEEIIAQIKEATHGGGTSPGPPPHAAIYHQVTGSHPSRYITIVVSPD